MHGQGNQLVPAYDTRSPLQKYLREGSYHIFQIGARVLFTVSIFSKSQWARRQNRQINNAILKFLDGALDC
jgi:hypothetical protein